MYKFYTKLLSWLELVKKTIEVNAWLVSLRNGGLDLFERLHRIFVKIDKFGNISKFWFDKVLIEEV